MYRLHQRHAQGMPLHHAYHLTGDRAVCEKAVLTFMRNILGLQIQGNPDVLVMRYVSLAVADARQLKEFASKKAIHEGHYFVISFQFATTEAQNALLKLFEEPTPSTYFFIITPSPGTLLPTVRSRVERLQIAEETQQAGIVYEFLSGNPKKRLGLLKEIIEEKDKEQLLALVGSLEMHVHEALQKHHTPVWKESAEALLSARRYLHGKSASVKMIGEYLAAVLPKV